MDAPLGEAPMQSTRSQASLLWLMMRMRIPLIPGPGAIASDYLASAGWIIRTISGMTRT